MQARLLAALCSDSESFVKKLVANEPVLKHEMCREA